MSKRDLLLTFLIVLTIVNLAVLYITRMEIRKLACEVREGFFAERQYVYPILREQGYNPDKYGKEIFNPLTTTDLKDC